MTGFTYGNGLVRNGGAGNTTSLLGETYAHDPFNHLGKITGYVVNAHSECVYKNRDGVRKYFAYAPDHTLLGEYTVGGTGWNDTIADPFK